MIDYTSSTIKLTPTPDVAPVNSIGKKIKGIYLSIFRRTRSERVAGDNMPRSINNSKFNFNFKKQNALKIIIPVLVFLVVGSIIFTVFNKKASSTTVLSAHDENDVKTVDINKTFKFPLKDNAGKSVGNFSYLIKSAELRHKIVVKGQTATSVEGRVFLIVNIKINNTLNQGLSINSRDYIRISVNGNDNEWFAPDIHNDPVEAQAISTTNTRVAIAINDSDKDIRLQVGEIGGKKEIIPVDFK